jgi:hypothetical protein
MVTDEFPSEKSQSKSLFVTWLPEEEKMHAKKTDGLDASTTLRS